MEPTREALLAEVHRLLDLIEMTGDALSKDAAIVGEFGGVPDQLREIISLHGRGGEAMVRAVARTRERLPKEDE